MRKKTGYGDKALGEHIDVFKTGIDLGHLFWEVLIVLIVLAFTFTAAVILLNLAEAWKIWLVMYGFVCAATCFVLLWKNTITLIFEGDKLHIVLHLNRKVITYSQIGRDAFSFEQSKKEKKSGCGTIYIFGTDYFFSHIRNYDAMVEYVNTHFE